MPSMKVVAKRPGDVYLVQTEKDKGQIADLDEGHLYPEHFLLSILARGYWEDFDDADGEVLKRIQALDQEPAPA